MLALLPCPVGLAPLGLLWDVLFGGVCPWTACAPAEPGSYLTGAFGVRCRVPPLHELPTCAVTHQRTNAPPPLCATSCRRRSVRGAWTLCRRSRPSTSPPSRWGWGWGSAAGAGAGAGAWWRTAGAWRGCGQRQWERRALAEVGEGRVAWLGGGRRRGVVVQWVCGGSETGRVRVGCGCCLASCVLGTSSCSALRSFLGWGTRGGACRVHVARLPCSVSGAVVAEWRRIAMLGQKLWARRGACCGACPGPLPTPARAVGQGGYWPRSGMLRSPQRGGMRGYVCAVVRPLGAHHGIEPGDGDDAGVHMHAGRWGKGPKRPCWACPALAAGPVAAVVAAGPVRTLCRPYGPPPTR